MGKSVGIEGAAVLEMDTGTGGIPGCVCEYNTALGAERKNAREANDGFDFLWDVGTLGVTDGAISLRMKGVYLFMPIGGGAAESNEEARVDKGPAVEGRL